MVAHFPAVDSKKRQIEFDHFKPLSKQKYEKKSIGSCFGENISPGSKNLIKNETYVVYNAFFSTGGNCF